MIGNTMAIITYLHGADLGAEWELKKKSNKRSLNQNSYYWVLLGKIADKMQISKTIMHNRMLRDYGQIQFIGDKPVRMVIPDTDEAEERILEADTYHLKPTAQVQEGTDGLMYRTYVMLRGSHDYNSEEMSILINGLVEEAKQIGIETLTPRELEKMRIAHKNEEMRDIKKCKEKCMGEGSA